MLVGRKVRIRGMEESDMEKILEWMNDLEITQFLGTRLPISRTEQQQWYERTVNDKSKKKMIIETFDGEPIGQISLMRIDQRNRSAEIGITIGEKSYWGQGIGYDATLTLLRFVFHEWGFHRVSLHVASFNERAIRLYKKLGFVQDGVLRDNIYTQNGYYDTLVMSILKPEFDSLYGHERSSENNENSNHSST